MTIERLDEVLSWQRAYFLAGKTLPVKARVAALKKLRNAIRAAEEEVCAALKADLGKSAFESYMCEVGLTLSEIGYMIKNVRRLAKERRVRTPLSQFASRSYKKPSPYGNVLIMSPWNYPFLLTIEPLVDAIAAGNTAIVKPSAYSPATSAVMEKLISACFPPEYVAVFTGGRRENAALLDKKFDLIFFTGSQAVGKEVLRRAAEHLTPAVLELGGKSPCIVDDSAKIALAAKRIVFGKFLNCGQTCVAPDYILCDRKIKEQLLSAIRREISAQFGDALKNPAYGKIVNEKHFDRLVGLIDQSKVAYGGQFDRARCKIMPTVLENVTTADAVMQEEIFGPVLPVLTYDTFEEVVPFVAGRQKPLALYIFSQNKRHIRAVTAGCSYGGGCVNDVVIHLATSELGFGGVGESGMGAYHGKAGFAAFSHEKSMVDKKTFFDLPVRYQPYTKGKRRLLRMFLK